MKKLILFVAIAFSMVAQAQTNVQLFYDFGSQHREPMVTATIEHLSFDSFGSNFFFIDLDFKGQYDSPLGAYMEYSRTLNFWQNTKAKDFSLHIEYNGGAAIGYGISHAVLGGIEYQLHSKDYAHFITFQALARYTKGVKVPAQFTMVWGTGWQGLSFSGFIDLYENNGSISFISEPQLWYNLGKYIKLNALHIGAEVELSYNFTTSGFMCNPCVGIKWVL